MTVVKTAQGLQDDFKCAKSCLNIQTYKQPLPVHNAVTCSPTLCLVTHLKAHISHRRARNRPQATCLVEKGLNERGTTAKCFSLSLQIASTLEPLAKYSLTNRISNLLYLKIPLWWDTCIMDQINSEPRLKHSSPFTLNLNV